MKYTDNVIFIPAVSIATHISTLKNDWHIHNKSPRFYLKYLNDDNRLFHHPYMLTSAAHNYKNINYAAQMGINDLKTDIDMLFGDSGGFQIATGAIQNVTDETLHDIYHWLETNATVAPIIDHPPYTTGMSNVTNKMKDSIEITKHNINILLSREKTDTDWLNVLHGRSYEQRCWWYDEMNDYDFYNGWAIGSLRKNDFTILASIASLMDKGELEKYRCKLIHFFGMSSMRFVPLMVYIKFKLNKKDYNINVSFDSSYATKDCAFGKYLTMMPDSTGFASYHLSNKLIGKFNKDAKLPCKCSVCKDLTLGEVLNEKALKSKYEYFFYNVVQSHNVLLLRDYIDKIQNIIYSDCEHFWESAFKSSFLKTFKVVDKIFDAKPGKSYATLQKYSTILNVDYDEKIESIENLFT